MQQIAYCFGTLLDRSTLIAAFSIIKQTQN